MTAGTKFDFHFDEALRGRGVTGAYSLLLGIDQNLTPPEEIAVFVDGVIAGVRERAVRDLITTDPVYAGFRELHKSFEVPTRKLLSAETLIRCVEKRGDIPRIGPLVDVYNAVSLETRVLPHSRCIWPHRRRWAFRCYMRADDFAAKFLKVTEGGTYLHRECGRAETRLSLGAHDLDAVTGGISVRLTTGAERYYPVGAAEPEPVRPGEYAYIDAGGDVICRLEVRQSEKTKVTSATRDVFLIVQGNAATPPAYVRAGHDRLIALLQRFFGGEPVSLYRP
jgi:DNA/RNA-binding domain of Phe-tRNA-synthetase-like protein